MTVFAPNRRQLTLGAAILTLCGTLPAIAAPRPAIHVLKDPNCGCCTAWAEVMQQAGFDVTIEQSIGTQLIRYKIEHGIPQNMTSCHTANIEGYMLEGHVPAREINRLLSERPDAVGLAVPEMPYGSPGMGPESERDAYDVFLIRKDGTTEVFASYPAA